MSDITTMIDWLGNELGVDTGNLTLERVEEIRKHFREAFPGVAEWEDIEAGECDCEDDDYDEDTARDIILEEQEREDYENLPHETEYI